MKRNKVKLKLRRQGALERLQITLAALIKEINNPKLEQSNRSVDRMRTEIQTLKRRVA